MLTDTEIRTFWIARDHEPLEIAAAFRLRLVTAQRGVEVHNMRWANVDLDTGWWTVPASDERAIAAGVSTRQYARTLDPVPAEVSERATSRCAVSRRVVALSTAQLRAFVSRPLGELDLRVVCIITVRRMDRIVRYLSDNWPGGRAKPS